MGVTQKVKKEKKTRKAKRSDKYSLQTYILNHEGKKCYRLDVPSQNSYVEGLTCNVTARDGAFGGEVG